MKRRLCSLLASLFVIFFVLPTFFAQVQAADEAMLSISGTCDYNEVLDVVAAVNRQRTESGLSALTLDAELSELAMKRASEIGVYYSHTRPNGTECFSIITDSKYLMHCAENIAVGYADAGSVIEGWMNSEGHRTNIMTSDFKSIGVGCFYQQNGQKTWVQLFSSASASGQIPSGLQTETYSIEYQESCVSPYCAPITLYTGEMKSTDIKVQNKEWSYLVSDVELYSPTYSVSDTSIATVSSDGTVTGINQGVTTISISSSGLTLTANVTVKEKSLFADNDPDTGYPHLTWKALIYEDCPGVYVEPAEYWFKRIDNTSGEILTFKAVTGSGKERYEYIDRNTTAGHSYTYEIVSYNWQIMERTGEEVSIKCVCGCPTATASADTAGIHISWTSVSGAAKYEVQISTNKDGTDAVVFELYDTEYHKYDAVPGTTYYCKVRAICTDGTVGAYSTVKPVTCTCAVPSANICADPASGAPYISWSAVDGASGYEILRALSKSGTYSKVYSGNSTAWTDKTAVPGTLYYYKIKTLCAGGSSGNSAYKSMSIRCKCAQPAPTITTTASSGKPTLKWTAAAGAESYEIWRATSKTGTFSKAYTTSKTSYTNTGATAGYTYYYKVRAVDASGNTSAYSTVKSITCDCARPEATIATVASSGKPKLSWKTISGAGKYYVYRSTDGGKTYSYLGSTTNTSYTNTGAVAGNTYYYKVKAVCERSSYGNSAESTAKYITCDCARPTVTIALSSVSGKPKLSWSKVAGANKYYVYRSTDGGKTYSYLGSTANTSYTNTGAVAGKTYYYRVKAVCEKTSYGNSAQSTAKYIKSK